MTTPSEIIILMDEALRIPLELRIAVKLHLQGITSKDFCAMKWIPEISESYSEETYLHQTFIGQKILNLLSNIEQGRFKVTQKMINLSEKI